jgi:hypothetical protein
MLSGTAADRPPWRKFLADVDRCLPEPVEVHCLGGFVMSAHCGLARPTADVDYVEVVPHDRLRVLQEIAGPESSLAARYGLYFQYVSVASLPESYGERLTAVFPGRYRNLTMLALEPHDLALSKLARDNPVDREDVAHLARTIPLDPRLLAQRYRQELRPIIMGDVQRHDRTLDLWIKAYFC